MPRPPDVEATARNFLGLKYTRDAPVITISCHKATDDLAEKLSGLGPRLGAGAQCTSPLPGGSLSRLESGAGPDSRLLLDSALPRARQCTSPLPVGSLSRLDSGAGPDSRLLPDSVLPRARSILGLAAWVVCHARPDAILAFVAIARRVSPERFAEYSWDRLLHWAIYLAKTRDVHLAMRKAAAGTGAACFSDAFRRRRHESFQTCEATTKLCSLNSSLGDASKDQGHVGPRSKNGPSPMVVRETTMDHGVLTQII